jgi:hypothetical protein
VRPARAQESSALAGRPRYLGHVPGALPRAGMLRAVGASSWLSSRPEKPPATQFMRWLLNRLRKQCIGCHSERSEESLPIENKRPRGILRANSALRMTVFRLFPQPVKPLPERLETDGLKPGPPTTICGEISKSVSASSSRALRGADRKDSRPEKIGRWTDGVPVRRRLRWYRNGGSCRPQCG